MRYPVVTDTHFGVRNDTPVFYKHQAKFWNDIFWPEIDRATEPVTRLFHLGDLTDRRKYINFITLEFAKQMFFIPARERGIKVEWLLGNHDLPFKNSLRLSSSESFREFENVTVHQWPTEVDVDGRTVLLLPWLCEENIERTLELLKGSPATTCFGHLELAGFDMYRGLTQTHGFDPAYLSGFQLVCTGHYHHKSSKGPIYYLGSPYEMIWSDYGDPRGFHWWDSATNELEFVENPHTVFSRYVYNDSHGDYARVRGLITQMQGDQLQDRFVKLVVKHKANPVWFDMVVDCVNRLGAHDVQFVDETQQDPSQIVVDTEESQDTLSFIHKYVGALPWPDEKVQTDVQGLMSSLYQDATQTTLLRNQ